MLTIDPKDVLTKKLYGLMAGSVGPRPIAFASTVNAKGEPNLSPFSFFNMVSAEPPLLVFSPLRRISNNTEKHTLQNVKETNEVVINVVNYNIVQQMSLSSTEYAEGINEFEKSGLTMLPSEVVKPFRVAESPVQFECKVNEVISLGEHGGAGNLVLCQVLKMHIDEAIMDEHRINQEKIDLVARMGGNWYTRANQGMFEIPKPVASIGMGIDTIPAFIKNSKILTGNDLGKLGTVEQMPTEEEVEGFIARQNLNHTLQNKTFEEIEYIAQEYLHKDEVMNAWNILLAKQKDNKPWNYKEELPR